MAIPPKEDDPVAGDEHPAAEREDRQSGTRRAGRHWRMAAIFVSAPVLVLALALLVGLVFFRDHEFDSQTVGTRIEQALQELAGEDYSVSVAGAGLSLQSMSLAGLTGRDVVLRRIADGAEVAHFARVGVGLDFWSLLSGDPRFDKLSISGGFVDRAAFPGTAAGDKAAIGGDTGGASTHPSMLMKALGEAMMRAETPFRDGRLARIRVEGVEIRPGLPLSHTGAMLEAASISMDDQRLILSITGKGAHSQFTISANWQPTASGGRQLAFGAGPFSLREWLPSPDISGLPTDDAQGTAFASDATLRLDGRLPFLADLTPQQPIMRLQAENGNLRIGPRGQVPLRFAVLNLRGYPEREQIELERSQLDFGNVSMELLGGLRPADEGLGFRGPLEIELIADDIAIPAIETDDVPVTAALRLLGQLRPSAGRVDLDQIVLRTLEALPSGTRSAELAGTGSFGLPGSTHGLSLDLSAREMSAAALRHAWPFFLAPNARDWFRANTFGGLYSGIEIEADLSAERLQAVRRGGGFEGDEFALSAGFTGIRLDLPGELPPLRELTGILAIAGSQLQVTADSAHLFDGDSVRVEAGPGTFRIGDMFAPVPAGDLELSLAGPLAALARIADTKPLDITSKAGLKAEALSGEAQADIAMRIPLAGEEDAAVEEWKADLSLSNAASSTPVFGRSVERADLLIHAEPELVRITGPLRLDGIDADLELAQPIGRGDPAGQSMRVSALVEAASLAEQGIVLDPVIRGPVGVTITSAAGSAERYELDLRRADLALPWIGWLKGAGIPARASFALSSRGGVTTLNGLSVEGDGFGASGTIVVSRNGLENADLKNVSLNAGDDFAVTVNRNRAAYDIAASGAFIDARSILNLFIHTDGHASEPATTDVSLEASFGTVLGFANRRMENTIVNYSTRNGLLSELGLRGAFGDRVARIDAGRTGEQTRFDFVSEDAGSALAMVGLYSKMQGGSLRATMQRQGQGAYSGQVVIEEFLVEGEERLKSLVSAPPGDRVTREASGALQRIETQRVRFDDLVAGIDKGEGWLKVREGRIRNEQIGLTFDGTLYDESDQMSVRGTFMPLFSLSRLVGLIPLVGDIFSNGRDSGLIGITYQLKGAARNPAIAVNPISIIAPGIFRKIFEFPEE